MGNIEGDRIDYLDIVKGFAITSVILYHVASPLEYHITRDYINTYFLSLFFFVSGYLSIGKSFVSSTIKTYLKNKARTLLVPFFACAILNFLYRRFVLLETHEFFLFSDAKGGYWFVLVLFYYFALLKIFFTLFKIFENHFRFVSLLIPFCIVVVLGKILPINLYYFFSLSAFRRFYLIFIFGVSFRYFSINLSSKYIVAVSSLAYIVLVFLFVDRMTFFKSEFDFILWLLTNMSGCVFWINICRWLSPPLSFIRSLGVNSLGIYVLHYFYFQLFCILYFKCNIDDSVYIYLLSSVIILLLSYYSTLIILKNKYLSLLFLGK